MHYVAFLIQCMTCVFLLLMYACARRASSAPFLHLSFLVPRWPDKHPNMAWQCPAFTNRCICPGCLQCWYQARSSSAGDLSAERTGLQQQPFPGQGHCHHGRRAHLLCSCLDQHPYATQSRHAWLSLIAHFGTSQTNVQELDMHAIWKGSGSKS